ncbi:hypothetical protein EON64_04140 [archaeon]|nr:MAG: hypothetical protein EON64_04140 [archaeon]
MNAIRHIGSRKLSFPVLKAGWRGLHSGGGIGLLGVCEDRNSSYLQGSALAPKLIRQALMCDSSNSYSELYVDVAPSIKDFGDVLPELPSAESLCRAIRPKLEEIVKRECRTPLILGGDHSISYPVIASLVDVIQKPVVVVHFDAHPDLYDDFEGNPWSHASPFARILENKALCRQLISFGIRTANRHQREQMEKYSVHVIEARDFPLKGMWCNANICMSCSMHKYIQIYIFGRVLASL